jgi:hypothetical protein
MGGVVYKNDEFLLSLGYEGPDAYLRNGIPALETVRAKRTRRCSCFSWSGSVRRSGASVGKSTFRHWTHPESPERRDEVPTASTERSREKVSSAANFIFTFSDAMG